MSGSDEQTSAAREIFCRLLAGCYYEPGCEFSEEKLFESMLVTAMLIDPELAVCAQRLGDMFTTASLEDLLVDHTRLFLGPPHALAKPYGSVWLDRETVLLQDSTRKVEQLYREGGFDIDEGYRELPDHIAAELEFLYLLIFRENQARRAFNPDALRSVADLRRRFLGEHLGVWSTPFTAAMKQLAGMAFYAVLADLTNLFVRMEAARAT